MNFRFLVFYIQLLLFYNNVNGQILKTYEGNYNEGSVSYQYYENNNQERIYHGKFVYIVNNSKTEGQFKNNKKDGLWKFSYTFRNNIYKTTETENFYGMYDSGDLVGEWKYSHIITDINIKQEQKILKTADFVKNKFKKINASRYSKGKLIQDVNYFFNSESLYDSIITKKYTSKTYPMDLKFYFKNGVLSKSFVRNISTGDMIENFDYSELVENIQKNYDADKNQSIVNGMTFRKNVYKLEFNENKKDNNKISFTDHYGADEECIVRNLITNKIEGKNQSFGFGSIVNSKTDEYFNISSELFFWFNLYSGSKFGVYRGSNSELVYPKISFIGTAKSEYGEYVTYSLESLIEYLKREDEYKKHIEAENRSRIDEENKRIEKERQEEIAKKEEIDSLTTIGENFIKEKKYKSALNEYNKAYKILFSEDIAAKIREIQLEINRIENLQNKRLNLYLQLKRDDETLLTKMVKVSNILKEKKKIYSKNYEICMNLLNSKFPSYYKKLGELFLANNTSGELIEETWNDNDQEALNLLMKFADEMFLYKKFHQTIVQCIETNIDDELKPLKSSKDPAEIINDFNQKSVYINN